jgi:hypothetical protein
VVPLVSLQSLHNAAQNDVTMVPQMFEFARYEANYSRLGAHCVALAPTERAAGQTAKK